MKKINYICGLLLSISILSCTKNFEEINTPPREPDNATNEELFNGIISSLPISAGEYSVMNSWLYSITQQGIVGGGNPYNFDNARDGLWDTYYQALASYRLIQSRITAVADTTTMHNFYGMLRTIMAYKTFKNTNYFGNIPYSEAGYGPLKGASAYRARYDNQKDIYTAILADLKWAVDNFSSSPNQFSPGPYDTFFKNDIAMWTKFANSLRLHIAVTMYDKDNALAGTHIAEALGKPLLEEGNDVGLWPANIPNLQFQWRQWSFTADCNLRMGSTMWNLFSDNNNANGSGIFDLRASIFFETNGANNWVALPQNTATVTEKGSPYNMNNRDADWNDKDENNYSAFNYFFVKDLTSIPELMLTAAQVYFLKAEVYNRGLGVAANQTLAKTAYDAGVSSSLNMWKKIAFNSSDWTVGKPTSATATPAEVSAVLNNAKVAYNTANPADALTKIYAQLWIDQYRQPFDAWTLLRRTNGKTPKETVNASYYNGKYGDLHRYRYPDAESNFNRVNWESETGGTDVSTKKIWIQP